MMTKAEEEKARVKRAKQAQKQEELAKIEIIPNINDLEDALSKAAGAGSRSNTKTDRGFQNIFAKKTA